MRNRKLYAVVAIVTSMVFLTGFGLGDIEKKVAPDKEDCDKKADPKKCKKRENLEAGAKVIAVGIAAKIIHEMIVQYKSSQVGTEDQVVADYKKQHQTLPPEPKVLEYTSSVKPGEVVKAGNEVMVASSLTVVPGQDGKPVEIQEKIEIFDNENNKESIKSLAKPVNGESKKTGAFKNEFKFTLPVGMPQGVYPIKTEVLLNGKPFNPTNNKMQLVLNVDQYQNYRIVALHSSTPQQ